MTTTSRRAFTLSGAQSSPVLLADGSLWSHAATFGEYVYGGERMEITPEMADNFIRVFTTGYPTKVPVDYEHDTAILQGERKPAGPIPKAGDILQLATVRSTADITAEMQTAVEKAGRAVDDPRNLGLWIRWRPTPRALGLLTAREYSEMSITFYEDYPHNQTGESQGPTIVSVALTNTPFLDGMVPITLTRATPSSAGADPGKPADAREPGSANQEKNRMKLYAMFSSLLGRPVTTEDEAADAAQRALSERDTQITTLTRERDADRGALRTLTAEIGEADPTKAVEKIRALKATADEARQQAETARTTALTAQIDGILKKHEDRIVPSQKEFFAKNLRRELEAGAKAGETETEKTLTSLPPHGLTVQRSGGDSGENGATGKDQKIAARAKTLMAEDAELKQLAATDRRAALREATIRAVKEIGE